MWNIKAFEANIEATIATARRRGLASNCDFERLVTLIARRRELASARDEINRQRNELSKASAGGGANEQAKALRSRVNNIHDQLKEAEQDFMDLVSGLPNLVHASVPAGTSESDNIIVHTWGTPRQFEFPVRDHVALGQSLGILDLARGANLAASGFPSLKGSGAMLSRQMISFMIDQQTRRGYVEIEPPFVCNRKAFFGTGQLPKFEQELYWTEGGTLGLVPTAEVPLTNLHSGEIIEESLLPLKYTAYTPCFRREAGTYGRDTRGIIRVHQFSKVELVKLTTPEQSYAELETMVDDAENILRLLKIPFRRVLLCAGDIGFSAAKTYDIEAWFPSQNRYREVSSVSNCEDFQALRANLRFRHNGGKPRFLHTLNGSGLAVGRVWASLLENCQENDGSVQIPEVLVDYLQGLRVIRPSSAPA
ncbi:MAG TPA: serine--tRNA ligase [Pyrinomonadaceae bacterium]